MTSPGIPSSPLPACACGHAFERHLGYASVRQDSCAGGTPGFCGCFGFRPVAPSEPPAAEDCGCGGTGIRQFDSDGYEACPVHLAMESPSETYDPDAQPWQLNLLAHHVEPPAETQQDDEPWRCVECGAVCDHRVQVCECGADCPLPTVQR